MPAAFSSATMSGRSGWSVLSPPMLSAMSGLNGASSATTRRNSDRLMNPRATPEPLPEFCDTGQIGQRRFQRFVGSRLTRSGG